MSYGTLWNTEWAAKSNPRNGVKDQYKTVEQLQHDLQLVQLKAFSEETSENIWRTCGYIQFVALLKLLLCQ